MNRGRRRFIQSAAAAAAAMTFPTILPSRVVRGADLPSNRIRVGQIGCGRIANQHDIPGVLKAGMADFVAVCDLDSRRAATGKDFIQTRDTREARPEIAVFTKHEELLARKDVDAVVISLPDHQHAQVTLEALRAGKDIYLQKPFTMTMEEGILLRDALMKSDRVFQIGSQQRSWGGEDQFRKACEFVRNGRVGRLTAVEIGLPVDPTAPDEPEQPIPANLDYDRWLGPTPNAYYTEQRVHSQRSITSRPGWLRNEAYSLGMITGWGAHHFDTAHWGMDAELTGPTRIEGRGEFPSNKIWNVHGAYHIELQYAGNVKMTVTDRFPNGIKFIGDEGWIFCSRDGQATASDPTSPASPLKPLDASNPKLLDPNGIKLELYRSAEHHLNWLECIKSRKPTCASAAVAHRSTAACIVSWIAMKLGRPLNFDPVAERFINDDAANAMLSRPERAGYGVMRMAKR